MLSSTTVEDDIRAALELDPRVPDPSEIAIAADELNVRLLDDARREDADIRGIALQILMWDVKVKDWITLKGTVTYQSDAASDDAASLYGVLGITAEIKVITP
jgi:hypothetical protein